MTRRIEGWERRLAAVIDRNRFRAFQWGVNDCGTLAFEVYEAVMGERRSSWSTWSTIREAAELLGQKPIEQWGDEFFGDHAFGFRSGRRGDIALVPTDRAELTERLAFGVVIGTQVAAPGEKAMAFQPLRRATMIWRVGD